MAEPISNLPELIFLCGFMGSGKTTIGRDLAEKLKRPFRDLDHYIEEQSGKTIPEIFSEADEGYFRQLERSWLLKSVRNFRGVMSLGGGALQSQMIVDHLKLKGLLIFIKTPFSVILDRIADDKRRPMLWNEEGHLKKADKMEAELKKLYQERLPVYRQAEITVDTGGYSEVGEITEALIKKIRNHVSYR